MSFADKFLTLYDNCKRTRPPGECRDHVIAAAPALIKTYLITYDACSRALGRDACRKVFAPAKREGVPLWALAVAAGVGYLIGRVS